MPVSRRSGLSCGETPLTSGPRKPDPSGSGVGAPLVLTVEEAAGVLRISRTAAYEAVRRGELPVVRIGRSLRIPRHALNQLLSAGPKENRPPDGG